MNLSQPKLHSKNWSPEITLTYTPTAGFTGDDSFLLLTSRGAIVLSASTDHNGGSLMNGFTPAAAGDVVSQSPEAATMADATASQPAQHIARGLPPMTT